MAQTVHMFWIGDKLGPVYAACIRSIMRQGHDVVMHQYSRSRDLPDGVKVFDAKKLMRPDEIVRHRDSGSLSMAANIYRYRMQREGLGLYLDCDVYLLKPVPENDYVLGWESPTSINNAVLKLPPESELLKSILDFSEDPYFIPPWLPSKRRLELRLRKILGWGKPISHHAWGTSGPKLVSYAVECLHMQHVVAPIDVFYPLHHDYVSLLNREGVALSHLVTPNSVGIHLTHGVLTLGDPMPGTALDEILRS